MSLNIVIKIKDREIVLPSLLNMDYFIYKEIQNYQEALQKHRALVKKDSTPKGIETAAKNVSKSLDTLVELFRANFPEIREIPSLSILDWQRIIGLVLKKTSEITQTEIEEHTNDFLAES